MFSKKESPKPESNQLLAHPKFDFLNNWMDQEAKLLDHRFEDSKYRQNAKANLLFEDASSDEEAKGSQKSRSSKDLFSPTGVDQENPGTVDFNLH